MIDAIDERLRMRLGATGHGWDHWCRLIDAWDGRERGHAAVAAWLEEAHDLDAWWAQVVTVGWERLTGRRLPYQQPDGIFTAGRSATIRVDPVVLDGLLRDHASREVLFGGLQPHVRSRPGSKTVRVAIVDGVVEIAVTPRADGRAKVTVTRAKLGSFADVAGCKDHWGRWLEALDDDAP